MGIPSLVCEYFRVEIDRFCVILLFRDWLVLGHKGLHDEPANEVGYGTVAEDNHVASRFACGAEELEGITKIVSIGEEHA